MINSEFAAAVKAICVDAGNAIMPFFPAHVDAGVTRKGDGSPVTHADPASEAIILNGLKGLTPNIPAISEEQVEDGQAPDVSKASQYWLVDPLDGTKEFIKGSPDFCINIGLIDKGVPVFGAVYCPATGDFYYGGTSVGGAFLNDEPITSSAADPKQGIRIIGTENYKNNARLMAYLDAHTRVTGHVTRGSTLKFCLIAEGKADFYARFVPTYEWDTAAAHAMLLAVGADIIDYKTGQRLTYGKENFLNGWLVTATDKVLRHFNL